MRVDDPLLDAAALDRGVTYEGTLDRLQGVARRLVAREPIRIVAIGGSTTAGAGSYRHGVFFQRFFKWTVQSFPVGGSHSGSRRLARAFASGGAGGGAPASTSLEAAPCAGADLASPSPLPSSGAGGRRGNHTVTGNGLNGTPSSVFNACSKQLIDSDGDLYILEFALNDPWDEAPTGASRVGFEQMLRKLLLLPQRPAVVMLHQFGIELAKGTYFKTAEQALSLLGTYYDVPTLSMRNAVWSVRDQPGFWMNSSVRAEVQKTEYVTTSNLSQHPVIPTERQYISWDGVHPSDLTGQQVMSELVSEIVRRAVRKALRADAAWARPIPRSTRRSLETATDRQGLGGSAAGRRDRGPDSSRAAATAAAAPHPTAAAAAAPAVDDPGAPAPWDAPWYALEKLRLTRPVRSAASVDLAGGDCEVARHPPEVSLPEPMIPGNYQSNVSTCYLQDDLTALTQHEHEMEWVARKPEQQTVAQQQWIYRAKSLDASIRFKLDTRVNGEGAAGGGGGDGARGDGAAGRSSASSGGEVDLVLSITRSWHDFADARLECLEGCTCATSRLEGVWTWPNTQVGLVQVSVTQAAECVFQLTSATRVNGTASDSLFELHGIMLAPIGSAWKLGARAKPFAI